MVCIVLLTLIIFNMYEVRASDVDYYPEEFASFFSEDARLINVSVLGVNESVQVKSSVSYDEFKLTPDGDEKITELFEKANIATQYVDKIKKQLYRGVSTTERCKVNKSNCKVNSDENTVLYIFDFDNDKLTIIPNRSVYNDSYINEADYETPISKDNALINRTRLLYSDSISVRDSMLTLNNNTTLGLPVGYMYSDGDMSINRINNRSSTRFELNNLGYNLEFDGFRLNVGYNDNSSEFNSTDFVLQPLRMKGDSITFGTSHNLKKKDKKNGKKLLFFAPSSGRLEIFKNGKLIYGKNVNQGQGAVLLSELPSGVYNIHLTIISGSDRVVDETRLIINNSNITLGKNESDFSVSAFKLQQPSNTDITEPKIGSDIIISATYSNRILDRLLLSAGVLGNDYDRGMNIGLQYLDQLPLNVSYVFNGFNSGAKHYLLSARFLNTYVNYQSYNSSYDDTKGYTNTLLYSTLGATNYEGITLGVNGRIGGYNYWGQVYNNTVYNRKNTNATNLFGMNLGLVTPIMSGTVSATYDVSKRGGFSKLDHKFIVTWTKKLNEDWTFGSSFYGSDDGINRNKTFVRHDFSSKSVTNSLELAGDRTKGSSYSGEFSNTTSYKNDYVNASSYIYARDNGARKLSLDLVNTQVLSTNGVHFTSKSASSYTIVDASNLPDLTKDPMKINTLRSDGDVTITDVSSPIHIYDNNNYHRFIYSFDDDSKPYEVSILDNNEYYSFPGSLLYITPVSKLRHSMVVILDDIEGNPINNLQCVGNGCVKVEELSSDGIFRVYFLEGSQYRLVANKGLCLYERSTGGLSYTGVCLPGNRGGTLANSDANTDDLVLIGTFRQGQLEEVESLLERYKIDYKLRAVESKHLIYVTAYLALAEEQKSVLAQLNAYSYYEGESSYNDLSFNK
ncbi:TcfC E-set like domain-containing protein [Vibrio cionasavignyae]|uniref:TcfC E-set like domain-containing protein n=1 Tax=Vibrio cionasavignyae TaxID=2910252 RepID=UPI003D0CC1A3